MANAMRRPPTMLPTVLPDTGLATSRLAKQLQHYALNGPSEIMRGVLNVLVWHNHDSILDSAFNIDDDDEHTANGACDANMRLPTCNKNH